MKRSLDNATNPPLKKQKIRSTNVFALVAPLEITESIKNSTQFIPNVIKIITEYSWGYDDEIDLKFGGTIKDWSELIGIKKENETYKFLKTNEWILSRMYPQLKYRKNGIFKNKWNKLPYLIEKACVDFYDGGDTKKQIKSMIKNANLSWSQQELNEFNNVWNWIQIYYESCSDTDSVCCGSALQSVWLPVGGILYNQIVDEAEQKFNLWEDAWDFIEDENYSECIASCGLYDTASRETHYSCWNV